MNILSRLRRLFPYFQAKRTYGKSSRPQARRDPLYPKDAGGKKIDREYIGGESLSEIGEVSSRQEGLEQRGRRKAS